MHDKKGRERLEQRKVTQKRNIDKQLSKHSITREVNTKP